DLIVDTLTKYVQIKPVPPSNVFAFGPPTTLPQTISAGSIGQIRTLFSPRVRTKYEGWLKIHAKNVPQDSVFLMGEGAAPVPVWSPVKKNDTLDFGPVFRGDTKNLDLTLSDSGNWTLSVIDIELHAPFSFSPPETNFLVVPDS